MLAIALTAVAVLASGAAVLVLRRRRSRRIGFGPRLEPRIEPLPAGVRHLASGVSELSDLGLHLHAARRAATKPTLGSLLGLR
jgi:hypothetical protein